MAALFSKLFKPKWQHQKPEIRIEAIKQLHPTNTSDQAILLDIIDQDQEPTVRCAAVNQIHDIDLLGKIAQKETNDSVKTVAYKQLVFQIVGDNKEGTVSPAQLSKVKSLTDESLLDYIALYTNEQELAIAAIDAIHNSERLLNIAINHSASRCRQAAIHKIEDLETLKQAVKQAKHKDKSVFRIAKEKLDLTLAEQHAISEARAKYLELTETIEKLATTEYSSSYLSKRTHIENQWLKADRTPDDELKQRYEAANKTCLDLIEQHRQEEEARQAKEKERQGHLDEQRKTCEELQNTLEQLKTNGSDLSGLPTLSGVIKTQQIRWQESTTHQSPVKAQSEKYHKTMESLVKIEHALQQYQAEHDKIEEKIKSYSELDTKNLNSLSSAQKDIQHLQKKISWPGIPEPELLKQLETFNQKFAEYRSQIRQQQKKIVNTVKDGLRTLEKEIDEGAIKPADNTIRQINQSLKQLPPAEASSLQKQLRLLIEKLQELRDWHGFATLPKKTELCEQMEALAEATDVPPEKRSKRIKELQEEWKALNKSDPASAHELWGRFKQAADKAYEPCKEHFHELSQQRQDNLKKRIGLCEQLEEYFSALSENSNIDWKSFQKILAKAKQEWSFYAPVNRAENKPVQERFNAVLGQLNGLQSSEYDQNIEQKNQLIKKAEQLLTDLPPREATEKAKDLQKLWKSVGITPYKEDQKLWKKFRAVCDELFKRRDDEAQEFKQRQQAHVEEANKLCEEVTALCEGKPETLKQSQSKVAELEEQFSKIEGLPRDQAGKLQKKFNGAVDQFKKSLKQAAQFASEQQWVHLREKLDLSTQLEQAVWGENFDACDVEALKQSWEAATDLPKVKGQFDQRFELALKAYEEKSQAPLPNQDELLEQHQLLCIRIEILGEIQSPPESQAQRMAYQVSRLSEGLGQGGSEKDSISQVNDLEVEWLSLTKLPSETLEPLKERFYSAHKKIILD